MKQTLRAPWRLLRLFLACLLGFVLTDLRAQQRYFAASLVNENDDLDLDIIEGSKEVGANAVALSVQWGSIEGKISRILKEEHGDDYNLWNQYDEQIRVALSLGMKIGLNIAVSTGDDVTNSASDRYGIDTGDGWLKDERMVVVNYDGQGAVLQKQGGPIRPGINLQFVMTSLAAQSTRDRIVSFTEKVIQRYKYLQDEGNLLYVNLIFGRNGEGEYDIGSTKYHFRQRLDLDAALTDYSQPMVNAYREWLRGKYGYINYLNSKWGANYTSFNDVFPKLPSSTTFSEPDGTDWFLFRTLVLRDVNNLFKNTVKAINPAIRVITHHGSVFDKLSRQRGTLPFDQIGGELDGIKINDDLHHDHRFALDLVRSNLPGRFYANEAAYVNGTQYAERLVEESFLHGANMVTMFHMDHALASQSAREALLELTDKWVKNKNVTLPTASNTDKFNLSNMIQVDGCETNRDSYSNDCDAYKKWMNAYKGAGDKPVNIFMVDDVTSPGCFYKDLKISTSDEQASAIIPNNVYHHLTNADCRIIGTVKGVNLTNGSLPFTAAVTVDPEVKNYKSQPYVQRHFEFKPGGTSPNQATLTLYVSQSEFTAFNEASSVKLPRNAGDTGGGKGKLRIWQWHGNQTLTGNPDAVIDPADDNIQWDEMLGLWRITFDVNGFSTFYVTADNATPLPVKLVTFSGEKREHGAELSWETSEEINSDHFEVQHSLDGKQWRAIGQVASSGQSAASQTYSFRHSHPVNGHNLYRLKMVDLDSSYAYSRIVSVSFDDMGEIVLYPNPVSGGEIHLEYTGVAPEIKVSDNNGRVIKINTEQTGKNLITVKSAELTEGLYILSADYGSKQLKYKVMVLR